MNPTGEQVAQAGAIAVNEGHAYSEMDCQAFIEHCVAKAGGEMAYRGSNDMARNVAWLGTIENAQGAGRLVPGALLFIQEADESGLPERYQGDGLGDFNHVGLYLGDGYGGEVAHSSASKGGTVYSTLRNGWTHVGLAREIAYGVALDANSGPEGKAELAFGIVDDEADDASAEGLTIGRVPGSALKRYATVSSANGYPVKLRKSANAKEPIYWKVNDGARVEVERTKGGWALIRAMCADGHVRRAYMMEQFLKREG